MAAALIDQDQQVLLTRRHADSHQGGLWEFPGGKLEPDETRQQCLYRELEEELGIAISTSRPLIEITHQYADRTVILDVHKVTEWHGVPEGREGQPLQWVDIANLRDYPMPAADVPIITALQLPDQYLISPPEVTDHQGFLDALETSLSAGVRLFQFRVFGLTAANKLALAGDALAICMQSDVEMLVNSDLELWQRLPATGLHLNRRQLVNSEALPSFEGRRVAASCHDLAELQKAEKLGVDFAVLSPVLPTPSHPDADVLGWEVFRQLSGQVALPVFALGGMSCAELNTAWTAGAQGIAGIRGIWGGR